MKYLILLAIIITIINAQTKPVPGLNPSPNIAISNEINKV